MENKTKRENPAGPSTVMTPEDTDGKKGKGQGGEVSVAQMLGAATGTNHCTTERRVSLGPHISRGRGSMLESDQSFKAGTLFKKKKKGELLTASERALSWLFWRGKKNRKEGENFGLRPERHWRRERVGAQEKGRAHGRR